MGILREGFVFFLGVWAGQNLDLPNIKDFFSYLNIRWKENTQS